MGFSFLSLVSVLTLKVLLAAAVKRPIPQSTILSLAHQVRTRDSAATPLPTPAPRLRRNDDEQAGTCGYIDGKRSSPYTCRASGYVCATNTYYGNHGCCDPDLPASSCTLLTTCIASQDLAKGCDKDCSSNNFIGKCSSSDSPNCVTLKFVYTGEGSDAARTTTMVEYDCAETSSDLIVPLTYDGYTGQTQLTFFQANVTREVTTRITVTVMSIPSPLGSPNNAADGRQTSKRAIIGGTVGGAAGAAIAAFGILFLLRRRKLSTQNQDKLENSNSASTEHGHSLGLEFPGTGLGELETKEHYLQIGGLEILEAPPNLNASELDAISELGGEEIVEAPGIIPGRA